MRVEVRALDTGSRFVRQLLPEPAMQRHLGLSSRAWIGLVDGQIACVWGLIPPTVMSDQAYLWLHVTEAMQGHEFNLVRYSQRMVQHMLTEFPAIVGYVAVDNPKAQRWITWLRAEFGYPEGNRIPFIIRREEWHS